MIVSVLTGTKKALGIDAEVTAFDPELIMHINSVLSVVSQLGIGPSTGFRIEDNTTTWDQLTDDPRLEMIKTHVYLRVRLIFDPPSNPAVITAMKQDIEEFTWRASVVREGDSWTDPSPPRRELYRDAYVDWLREI